jgi:ankyrin repeat protein
MTRGYFPKHVHRVGNVDFMADGSRPDCKYFLRLDRGAHVQLLMPDAMSLQGGIQHTESPQVNSGQTQTLQGGTGHTQYSISMCFRFTNPIPCQGAAVLGIGSLAVRATPTGIVHLQGLHGTSDLPIRKCLKHSEWSVLTLTVDSTTKCVTLWIDGVLVHEQNDMLGLCEMTNNTVRVFGCDVALCNKSLSGVQSVRGDLRMVQVDTCILCSGEILAIHVPLGVWTCACGERNGGAFSTCRSEACGAEKRKSAPRPEGDKDPDKPGLTIIVNDSFQDIVLHKDKHCFLDLTASWCGPSVRMAPEWEALAYLLKDYDDIIVGKMDADANEIDRFYLPEQHVPVLKLFPKGDKANYVSYPDGQPRTCVEFVRFLEQYTELNINEFREHRLPEYLKEKQVPSLVLKAQSALACMLQVISKPFATKSSSSVESMRREDLGTGDILPTLAQQPLAYVRRFVAQYLSDTESFPEDSEALMRVQKDGEWSHGILPLELVRRLIAEVKQIIESCLSASMPDDPCGYIPQALLQQPIVFGPHSKPLFAHDPSILAQYHEERKKPPPMEQWTDMFNKAKRALSDSDARALEKLLLLGLPACAIPRGESLVCLAAAKGNVELLELLFIYGGDLAERANESQHDSLTPLEIASLLGHKILCEYLLNNGACIGSSLLKAVEGGHAEIVQRLLAAGASPDVRINGRSAVHVAVLSQRDDILGQLLSHGAHLQRPLGKELCKELGLATGSNVLHAAAKMALVRSIKEVLKRWPEGGDQVNDAHKTPFDMADIAVKPFIRHTFLDTLRKLRACVIGGRHGNKRGHGRTAYEELKQMFDEGKADANAQDVRGWTALMAAAIANDADSCELLCQHGAKWQEKGRNDLTALFWANAANANEARKVLEKQGAKLSAKEQTGLQALRYNFSVSCGTHLRPFATISLSEAPICTPKYQEAYHIHLHTLTYSTPFANESHIHTCTICLLLETITAHSFSRILFAS